MVKGGGKYRNRKMTLQWALTDASRVRNTDLFKLKMVVFLYIFIYINKHGYYQETK